MIEVLGVDPGKTTGWATIYVESTGTIRLGEFGVTMDMTLVDIKDRIQSADIIVVEGFWARPDKAMKGQFNWQNFPAEEVIGSLLTLCKLFEKKSVKQQPSQRVPGYGFAGLEYKKGKKGTHWQDALAHAVFYAVRHLKANPVPRH